MINDHLNIDSSTNQDMKNKTKQIKHTKKKTPYCPKGEFEVSSHLIFQPGDYTMGIFICLYFNSGMCKIYFASQENQVL